MSEQTVQVQQEPVSTSETAESTSETSESVDESSSEIEDADSIESETTEPADEASEITDETVESTDTNGGVQVDEPGTVRLNEDIKTQIQEVSSALSLDDTSFTLQIRNRFNRDT